MIPQVLPPLDLRIFISYSHRDRDFVNQLGQDLRAKGIPVLIDGNEIIAGESIRRRLEEIIDSTDVFLIVISPDSVSSSWVQEELDLILERITQEEAVAIPLIVREAKLPGFIRGKKHVEFSNYESALEELAGSLQAWDHEKYDRVLAAKIRAVEMGPQGSSSGLSRRYTEVGALGISIGRYGAAIKALQRGIEVHPRNWDAHFLLSVALIKAKRFDEAEAILREVLRRRVQKARAHYNLACIYSRRAEQEPRSRRDQCEQLLSSCLENIKSSIALGFVSWLKRYGGRTDPLADMMNDPDLIFARGRHPEVEALLQSLAKKWRRTKAERYVFGSGGGGGGGCLIESMTVLKPNGVAVPVHRICPGDFVLTADGEGLPGCARVWRTMRLWEEAGVILNGTLAVTFRQPLYSRGCWKPASSLEVGDAVLGLGGVEIVIERIERWAGLRSVYQISLEETPVFVAEGILVHNAKSS